MTIKATAQTDCHSSKNVIESLIKFQPTQRPRSEQQQVGATRFQTLRGGVCVCFLPVRRRAELNQVRMYKASNAVQSGTNRLTVLVYNL